MLDRILGALGGMDMLKSHCSKITDVLNGMKHSEEVKKHIKLNKIGCSVEDISAISINVFKNKKDESKVNFAYIINNVATVYENHSVSSLSLKLPLLVPLVPLVSKMLDSVKQEKKLSNDELLVLTITNKIIKGKETTVIMFINHTKNIVYSEQEFSEILNTII